MRIAGEAISNANENFHRLMSKFEDKEVKESKIAIKALEFNL